jgi:FkbM family methyltransferase
VLARPLKKNCVIGRSTKSRALQEDHDERMSIDLLQRQFPVDGARVARYPCSATCVREKLVDRALIDLMLLQSASRYDLRQDGERRRSNKNLIDLFVRLQRRLRPQLTFEIGAFNAEVSLEMRRHEIRAIAFEANPFNFNHFSRSEPLNSSGVEYIHKAISKQTGHAIFNIQRAVAGTPVEPIRGNNSILMRAEDGVDYEYEPVSVPCITLDEFRKGHGLQMQTFSAWIDVEGAVGDVLLGAQGSFGYCLSIMVEVEQHKIWNEQWMAWEVMDFLMAVGFLPIARDFEFAQQFIVIFIKRELLENSGVRDALALCHSENFDNIGQVNR